MVGDDFKQEELLSPFPAEIKQATRHPKFTWLIITCILLSIVTGLSSGYIFTRIFPVPATTTITSKATFSTTTAPLIIVTAPNPADALSFAEIARIASPSVVVITTETLATSQNMQQYVNSGAGSGVILSADGLIVTNDHVIADTQKITVQLSTGESYPATLVGTDVQTDLAILKIETTGLKPAAVGDSSRLVVGDQVVAIGNPLGVLGGTVSNGIISALDRAITVDNETKNLLQTNASINPGNSGGGLFDVFGRLIGIVEAKSSGTGIEGIGFAIPINDAKPIVEELINYGYVRGRIDLGMTLLDIDTQQKVFIYRVPQTGVFVLNVMSGGSADTAGLVKGDCILSIDGAQVATEAEINALIETHQVGDSLSVVVLRSGKQVTLTMVLQEEKPISKK